jgi:hypothetical protein
MKAKEERKVTRVHKGMRLDTVVVKGVMMVAEKEGRTFSNVVERALKKYLVNYKIMQ